MATTSSVTMRDSTLANYPAEHQSEFMTKAVASAVADGDVVVASFVSLGEDETCILVLARRGHHDHFIVQRCEGALVGSRWNAPREESTVEVFSGKRLEALDAALSRAGYNR